MPNDPNQNPPSVDDRLAALERAVAAPREQPAAPAQPQAAPAAPPGFDYNALATALVAAQAAAQQAAPAAAAATTQQATAATTGAAAPSAPSAPSTPATWQGIVDLFALSAQQIDQLGPSGLRQHFESALKVGKNMMGLPPRPQTPPRGNR